MKAGLKRIRFWLIPTGSQREKAYHALRVALLILRQEGWRTFFNRFPWWLRTYWQSNPQSADQLQSALAYQRWIKSHEPDSRQLVLQRHAAEAFAYKPLITIITPVYNPQPEVLNDTLQSVVDQTYPYWEFCLADGNSTQPEVRAVLDDFARRDKRIKVQHLPQNLGIAGNSNAALSTAQGDFIALLDHDDLIAPDMLFEVAQRINQNPDVEVVYFDEDKISVDLRRRSYPWFKPSAFSPDLMLSTNVLMHSVIRHRLVDELGGFDSSVDGAQDWDLSLRIIEKTHNFIHIPRVFYHWRQVPGSAASDANAKPWAFPAQQRCVENHLERIGVKGARVEFRGLGTIHVLWPQSTKKVSIIIPTKDKVDLLRACLNSIFEKTSYPDYEIILVDNGSMEPETLAYYQSLQAEPRLHLLHYDATFNYHAINNYGVRHAQGEILVFLNNDTQVLETEWLQELASWAQRPEVGVVGAKLIRPDGSIQHAGIIIGLGGHGSHVFEGGQENLYGPFGSTEWYRDYQAVTGACLATRREVFEELGCFDELYQVGYGDIDLCLRAVDAGYRVVYTPFARLLHHEGGSRGFTQPPSDVIRASMQMYVRVKAGDPYFNPNLSDWQRLPAIRQPQEKPREWILLKILYDFDLVGREDVGAEAEQRWQAPYSALFETNIPANPATAGKRLLLISHELSRTGAPISLNRVANHLQGNGYNITVLSPFEGPLRQVYEEAGMRVRVLPSLLEDARIILEELYGHDLLLANTILAFRTIHAARAFNKPVVWWVHESTFGQKWAFSSPCVAQAFQQADHVAFPARAMADLYRSFSTRDNFNPIHTGFDLDTRVQPDCESGTHLESEKFNVIAVASVESRKGQDVLIRAIEMLPVNIRDQVTCLLIGRILSKSEPAYCRNIQRAARRLGNVKILGDLPVEQVHCYLQKVDAFVLASRDEALPLSLVEAMAFGKAIITTDVGGNREIIQDGVHGLLIPKEDPQRMAQALLKLYHDRNLGQRMGANARERYLASLTFRHMGDGLKTLVEETLQKRI